MINGKIYHNMYAVASICHSTGGTHISQFHLDNRKVLTM